MRTIFLFLIIFLVTASSASPQFYKRKINKYKKGLRTGLWISYTDSTKKQFERRGKFKSGTEKGTWKYYSYNGNLRRKEKYRKNKIFTTDYYSDGKKECCGIALIVEEGKLLHYYYSGEWKCFDRAGQLEKVVVYDKGIQVSSTKVTK